MNSFILCSKNSLNMIQIFAKKKKKNGFITLLLVIYYIYIQIYGGIIFNISIRVILYYYLY